MAISLIRKTHNQQVTLEYYTLHAALNMLVCSKHFLLEVTLAREKVTSRIVKRSRKGHESDRLAQIRIMH